MKKSPFQRQMERDFLNTFLKDGEFGMTGRWNDTDLRYAKAVIPDELTAATIGVNCELRRIVCREADLKPMPEPGESVTFDRVAWDVRSVQNPLGHLVITLSRNIS